MDGIKMNDIFCDIDEGFTRREIYDETNWCLTCVYIDCKYNQNKQDGIVNQ